jgi:hypothetical protein
MASKAQQIHPRPWYEGFPDTEPIIASTKGHRYTDDWPLVTYIWDVYDGSILPPRNVKLSDAWVYMVLHCVPPQIRGQRWPFDFVSNGGIRATRKPVEPTVVIIDANQLYYPVTLTVKCDCSTS